MWRVVLLVLVTAVPLHAALTAAGAMAMANKLWGSQAKIGLFIGRLDTNWTRQVGVSSIGCAQEFTVFGTVIGTWDAAFEAAARVPPDIKGPVMGTIQLRATAVDDVGIVGVQFRIDGKERPEITVQAQLRVDVTDSFDTTTLAPGIHVICVTARDEAGNVGRSQAHLFRVDQQAAVFSDQLRIPNLGVPSVAVHR